MTVTLPARAPALLVTAPGGIEVLQVRDLPVGPPAPGEALVRVAAAGVNFIDVYQREGRYPVPVPYVAGMEGAGEVVATGEGVTSISVGDRVAWAMQLGAAATYAAVPASALVPVPDEVPLDLAAAAMLQGMTAHYLVHDTYPVQPGDCVLVHAAAGGVGQLLVQLASAAGARVIATAGSAEKCAIARRLGAATTIDYRAVDDLAEAIRAAAPQGCAAAYDGVGRDTFDASLASLRRRGVLALFGAASGPVPPFDPMRLNAGSLYVTRPSLADYVATPDELHRRARAVLAAVGGGTLRIDIGGRYRLDDAASAYGALQGRATTGKLLLLP